MYEVTSISTVANYLLDVNMADLVAEMALAEENRKGIKGMDHARINLLCYQAQGWHLAMEGVPLFEEEALAGKTRPTYHTIFDLLPVNDLSSVRMGQVGFFQGHWIMAAAPRPDEETALFLDWINETYRAMSNSVLLSECTRNGTPFNRMKVLRGLEGMPYIPKRMMKDWYTEEALRLCEDDEADYIQADAEIDEPRVVEGEGGVQIEIEDED